MDSADAFTAQVEAQKKNMQAAKARKGQNATNKESRREIAFTYAKGSQPLPVPNSHQLRTNFITFAYPPSTTPLRDLKPIRLSELRLETHHTGRVLFVRTFTDAIRMVAVQVGIEDAVGDVDHLSLYNGDPKLKPAQILPKDAIFAVKEPYYKASAAGGYLVRVDHPSDLIKLPETHDSIPAALLPRLIELDKSAETWKVEGNRDYKARNFLAALENYTRGVAACTEEDNIELRSDLLRNRSIVNLRLHRYEHAATDAMASITSGVDLSLAAQKGNAKAYYRTGCALYHQGLFKEALKRFDQSLSLFPEDADCLREISRSKSRINEQTHGNYGLAAISRTVSEGHTRLDHASFLANVEVRKAANKGRGLFATTDLKAGDLVLCEKAFLVTFASDGEAEICTILNLNTNTGVMGVQATLTFNLVQKMLYNPTAAAKYFDLFDGGYAPKCEVPQVDGVVVVDTFQAAAIRECNGFGCPAVRSTDAPKASDMDSDPRSATGIWLTASYINHACAGNADRSFVGDLMIIRASKDIAKGTEITMSYRAAEADHTETRKALQKSWKFKCDCDLCAVELKTGGSQLSRRKQLIKDTAVLLKSNHQTATNRPSKDTVAKGQKLYDQLEATYDKALFKDMPRLALIELGLWLLSAQPPLTNGGNIIDRALEILRNCGYQVQLKQGKDLHIDYSHSYLHPAAADAAVHAAETYFFKGNAIVGKQFVEFAKKLYVMRYGVLVGFAERYGRVE